MSKQKSRPVRWAEACTAARKTLDDIETLKGNLEDAFSELQSMKEEYESWQGNLPENLQGGSLADKLDTIVGLDFEPDFDDLSSVRDTLDEAENAELPRGFGRD